MMSLIGVVSIGDVTPFGTFALLPSANDLYFLTSAWYEEFHSRS